MTWEDALAIAGSEERLLAHRGKKTIQNWRATRNTGKKEISVSALADLLYVKLERGITDTAALLRQQRQVGYVEGYRAYEKAVARAGKDIGRHRDESIVIKPP